MTDITYKAAVLLGLTAQMSDSHANAIIGLRLLTTKPW